MQMRQMNAVLFAVSAWLACSLGNVSQGAPMQVDTVNPPQKLVILGASYAASWGTPPLPGYTVVNRGVGGEETQDMLARFQRDVVAAATDAVLIWGHVNNFTRSAPEQAEAVKQATREHYLQMLQEAREAGITVLLATEIPRGEPTGWIDQAVALVGRLRGKQSYAERINAHVRELNEFVRGLAAREGLRLLDFERVLAPDGGAREPEFTQDDLSHVTAAGYAALTAYATRELQAAR
jgi:lysophospholipase L1-like esterase